MNADPKVRYRVSAFAGRSSHPESTKTFTARTNEQGDVRIAAGLAAAFADESEKADRIDMVEIEVWLPAIQCWKRASLGYRNGLGQWARYHYTHPARGGAFNASDVTQAANYGREVG